MNLPSINAGDLTDLVKIRTRTPGRDAMNGPIVTDDADDTEHAASIVPLTMKEYEHLGVTRAEATHMVKMRSWSTTQTIKPKDALETTDGRTLEIVSVINPRNAGVLLEFVCKELVS